LLADRPDRERRVGRDRLGGIASLLAVATGEHGLALAYDDQRGADRAPLRDLRGDPGIDGTGIERQRCLGLGRARRRSCRDDHIELRWMVATPDEREAEEPRTDHHGTIDVRGDA
jgi:hypothetical protein